MKPHLRSLKKGQEVWALVEETMAQNELMINFGGDLIRVANETGRLFRGGQRVLLQVRSVNPLKFQLLTGLKARQLERSTLDVLI